MWMERLTEPLPGRRHIQSAHAADREAADFARISQMTQ